MRLSYVAAVGAFLFGSAITQGHSGSVTKEKKPITIALTQIVSHPSLDEIHRGVRESLAQKGFAESEQVHYLISNASGDFKIASQIAQKIASQKPTVVVAITTPSAQTLAKTLQKSKTPLVFAAVTDPVQAHLVPTPHKSGRFITGTIDFPPVKKQVELIKILNENVKVVGILYSLSESNAVAQVAAFERAAHQGGLRVVRLGVSKSSDIPQASQRLLKQVDCVMVLNDNTIVSSIESLLLVARKHSKPVFASDPDSVKRGALAALAHDQYQLGFQTGTMVAELLKGKTIQEVTPQYPLHSNLYHNDETAALLDINPQLFKVAQKELLDQDIKTDPVKQ